MLTLEQYFGRWMNHPDATPERKANARVLLDMVNNLLARALVCGVVPPENPHTECCVAGETFGGFRPQSCPQGAPHSSHKDGAGVDVFDPKNELDDWLTDELLEEFGLYREHPDSTKHWCHLTYRAPHSGHRTFLP